MQPLVSISCITYNHAPYIRDALDGFLLQKTTFPFEILIHDDASVDGTTDIIREYASKYPYLIFPIYQIENQYSKGIRRIAPIFNFSRARGRYIAICEGDDYWTDPYKLQKQVDFLEEHPECSLTSHNVLMKYQDNSIEPRPREAGPLQALITLEDILIQNLITTCSAVFRNGLINKFPDWYFSLPMGDWPLWVLLARHGKLAYMHEVMATYRIHSSGAFSSKTLYEWLPGRLKAYDCVKQELSPDYDQIIEKGKAEWTKKAIRSFLARNNSSDEVKEEITHFDKVFGQYFDESPTQLAKWHGELYVKFLFQSAGQNDYAKVRKNIFGLFRSDSSWFHNRGIQSLAVRAFLGEELFKLVKKCILFFHQVSTPKTTLQ